MIEKEITINDCPFCGNSEVALIDDVVEPTSLGRYLAYYTCTVCNCRGPQLLFRRGVRKTDALRLAAEDWNKRGNDEKVNIGAIAGAEQRTEDRRLRTVH
ncbi:hypothetical protein LEP1GSC047_3950 [Leptospira inadai serovar Lyme str. 10]|uniref:Restriction alleviation protein, Lar family n=1 Tax=Leptospira inadai serovar Lyme str. 10 TaxID=1049790 RepID=V6HYT7_9LEPT|nr:Lar family restriction alleviation protein [Leptospira inadai]EQA38179.1 hypothetical protein LEP1GSC047_3950 [Leptospira inadai serovar Lyme str. 10]